MQNITAVQEVYTSWSTKEVSAWYSQQNNRHVRYIEHAMRILHYFFILFGYLAHIYAFLDPFGLQIVFDGFHLFQLLAEPSDTSFANIADKNHFLYYVDNCDYQLLRNLSNETFKTNSRILN